MAKTPTRISAAGSSMWVWIRQSCGSRTARKGAVLDGKTVEARQKGSALQRTLLEIWQRAVVRVEASGSETTPS
eukprot:SAG22_NODE_2189_length_2863_cov_3.101664_2_plen_74_part_00